MGLLPLVAECILWSVTVQEMELCRFHTKYQHNSLEWALARFRNHIIKYPPTPLCSYQNRLAVRLLTIRYPFSRLQASVIKVIQFLPCYYMVGVVVVIDINSMKSPCILCNICMATHPCACACIFHKTLSLMLYLHVLHVSRSMRSSAS